MQFWSLYGELFVSLFFIFMRRFTFTANVLHVGADFAAAAFEIQFCAAAAVAVAENRKAQPQNSYEANNAVSTATIATTLTIKTITKAQPTAATTRA